VWSRAEVQAFAALSLSLFLSIPMWRIQGATDAVAKRRVSLDGDDKIVFSFAHFSVTSLAICIV
jgi:hypothetical protein